MNATCAIITASQISPAVTCNPWQPTTVKNAERKAEQQEKDGKLPTKKPLKPNRTRIIYDPKKHGKGPGTELKKILSKWGIKAKANCACNKNMKIMDESGPDWCDANLETIVDWIEKEAKKRSLPFLRIVGRKLVRMAIKRARKAK